MTDTTELAIRLARAAFNRALAHKDPDTIAGLLTREAILITGTDSAILNGRKAQMTAWKRQFASGPETRTIYTRTPDTILPSPSHPIAMEHGQWQGVIAGSGQTVAHGSYCAKWRQQGGRWQIEAEIYLTLA